MKQRERSIVVVDLRDPRSAADRLVDALNGRPKARAYLDAIRTAIDFDERAATAPPWTQLELDHDETAP